MKKNWYAVYTKQHCEQKVANLLTKKGVDNYCPVIKSDNYYTYRKKMAQEALFPSFVFVYISESEMSYIRQANDVISFIYWLGKPAVIKEADIRQLQHFTNLYANIRLEKIPVNMNAMAHSINELVKGANEDVLTLKKVHIKLSLPSLGYMLISEAEKTDTIFDFDYNDVQMVS